MMATAAAPVAADEAPAKNPYGKRMRPVKGQLFDEVRIFTVPRYKTSWASGDEWRFSATTELRYKGKVLIEDGYSNVDDAMRDLDGLATRYRNSDAIWKNERDPALCDQEGCAEPGTVILQAKGEKCTDCGHEKVSCLAGPYPGHRLFCKAHSTRGDCSLNDADDNYIVVEGQVAEPDPAVVSRSAAVFLVASDEPDGPGGPDGQ